MRHTVPLGNMLLHYYKHGHCKGALENATKLFFYVCFCFLGCCFFWPKFAYLKYILNISHYL